MEYKCIKGFSLEKCDDDGFTIPGEYYVVEEGELWITPEDESYRFIGGEIRLENEDGAWLEIDKETLEEHFEEIQSSSITNIQQARAIIKAVGEPYQHKVVELLREQTCYSALVESERQAQKVIENMEHEYALNVANTLWKDKFEDIPEHIKKYS